MFERHNWVWLLIAALLLALTLVTPLGGRKGNHPKSTTAPVEKTISGTIEEVNHHMCEICKWVELSVLLKTDAGRLEVRLGPKTFFEAHDFHMSRGDAIQITGVRFMERGKEVVLANEVRKAGESLLLRGKDGKPAWVEARGHLCPVCGN